MIITCEKCGKSFNLNEKLLKPGGTKLQCSKCKHIFTAFPPGQKKPPVKAPGIELITCEKCGAGFNMKSDLLKPEGAKVRCSKCKHIFLAFPSSSVPRPEVKRTIEKPEKKREVAKPKSSPKDAKAKARDAELDLALEEEPAGASDDLDLELDAGRRPAKAKASGSNDLDLNFDLEEEPAAEEPSGSSGDLELELDEDDAGDDLDLDLDENATAEEPSGSSGDLELELDSDEGEIDFSEVDTLLESEDMSAADTVEVSKDDLDLDLDLDDDKGGGAIEQQEIDLADLEQTIEMELLEPEEHADAEAPEDVELELSDDGTDQDQDEELSLEGSGEEDFSDIEEMLSAGEDEDVALDLDGEEAKAGEAAAADGKAAGKGKKPKAAKKVKAKKEKKAKADKEGKKPPKKVLVVAAIVAAVLIVLVVGGYFLSKTMGFSPGSLGFGKTAPVGTVNVMANTLQSDFVDNTNHGKLFVVRGSVKNESADPKRFIKVTASLYSEGHKLEMTAAAYCGNILSAEELAAMTLEAIEARLANQAGDNGRNTDVKPGGSIPFIIVIPRLPDNLVEYEVLVAEASPVN